jgi:hypothetical protein
MPVGFEVFFGDAEFGEGYLGDALQPGFLRDFDVGGHHLLLLLRDSIVLILWGETL